jgi:DegV family protein with EDD domain
VEGIVAIRIVVDSTADIPSARARELGITVVPLSVLFGDESFLDGVELDGPGFYRKLASSAVMPTTSAPSPGAFDEAYRRLIAQGTAGILSLHLAGKMSATYSVASGAARAVSQETGVPIEVVDSGSVSAGFGLPAEMLARDAAAGASLAALKTRAESLRDRVQIFAVLDSLEHLQRGGRIGAAQRLLGTLLNVKPMVGVRDGEVVPLENVRTRSRAYERIGQMVAALGPLEGLAIVHSAEEAGAQLEQVVREVWSGPIEQFLLGPVVGAHGGPGAAGVAAIKAG